MDPTRDYRLTFTGIGSHLKGEVFDLADLSTPLPGYTVEWDDDTYTEGFSGLVVATADDAASPSATFDNFELLKISTLTWDSTTNNWGSAHWAGGPPSAPDVGTIAIVPGGAITVAAAAEAYSLDVTGGSVAINGGETLAVQEGVTFAPGTSLTMAHGAVLSAGGGSIDSLAADGDVSIAVTSGFLSVGSLSNASPGALTKQGGGALSVKAADLLASANVAVLDGGRLSVEGEEVLSANALAGLFYDVPNGQADTIQPIDSGNGVFLGPADWNRTLAEPLDFGDNTLQPYAGVPEDDFVGAWRGHIIVGGPNLPAGDVSFGMRSDDGNVLYIDLNRDGNFSDGLGNIDPGELIAADNSNHGFRNVEGTANLQAGTYDFATAFYERGGGDGMTVKFGAGAGLLYDDMKTIDPTALDQSGIWQGVAHLPIAATALDVEVVSDSTLHAVGDSQATFGHLTLKHGNLTTTATSHEGIAFLDTTIHPDATRVGFDPQTPTDYGTLANNSTQTKLTIVKAGPSTWALATAPEGATGTGNVTWEARDGTLEVTDPALLGDRPVVMAGGTLSFLSGAGAPDFSGIDLTVTEDSTLEVVDLPGDATFKSLTMQNGTLNVAGSISSIDFTATTLAAGVDGVVGIHTTMPTYLGPITADGVTPTTVTKTGAGDLILDAAGAGLDHVTFAVNDGSLIGQAAAGAKPLGGATVVIDGGGTFVASATPAATSLVTYNNAIHVIGNGTLSAAAGPGGHIGPMVSSVTGPVTLDAQLELSCGDGYELNVGGTISGPGELLVNSGTVTLSGSGNAVGSMKITGGTVSTADGDVTLSKELVIGGTNYVISAPATFRVSGSDLA
ncbi:MAG: hypothetical protein HQ567_23810, partial [Candidatus Nealsonbacteria bacterium]|nr:hypothetical protein [Candidatus Nealsonbacteria bacterium]